MSVFFDFSEVYKSEYSRRNSGASFYKYLDEADCDLDYFIKEIVCKENAFFISCSCAERRLFKDINFDCYKNFFIRPKACKYQFVGDFVVTKDNESYYRVKDIYINESYSIKRYEKEFSFDIKIRNDYKKSISDLKLIRNIVNNTDNVYDYHYLDFIRDFDGYLEFEKKHFLRKLGFYKTLGFKAIELKEIKRSFSVCKKYEEDTYFDDGNNFVYIDGDKAVEEEYNKVIAIEFLVKIDNTESAFNALEYFISQDIEIANEKDAVENNELKSGGSELEFSFKTQKLGGLLKSLELVSEQGKEVIYSFSKFYSEEDSNVYYSFARVGDYVTSFFGQKPLLVNILSGDVALYKRGKQALKDLKEGNVKNPGIASYLFNIGDSETSENIIKREDIVWSNNLDKYQKEAVYKAINSNSIFLLQGPPGTGKTQTITEMVYQLNKLGKKVLLSSQTHVAIDNVIERLPDELDVLPIRLINSDRKNKSNINFLPDRVVDNFYEKMKNKYLNKKERFALYSEEIKRSFKDFKVVEELVDKYGNIRLKIRELKEKRNRLRVYVNDLDNKINVCYLKIKDINETLKFINEFKQRGFDFNVNYENFFIGSELINELDDLSNKYKIEKFSNFKDFLSYFKVYFKDDEGFLEDYKKLINKNISFFERLYNELKNELDVYNSNLEKNKEERRSKSFEIEDISKDIFNNEKGHEKNFKVIDEYFNDYFENKIMLNKRPLNDEECLKFIKNYIEKEKDNFSNEEYKYNTYKDLYDSVINYIEDNKEDLLVNDRVKYSKFLLNNNANVYSITCNANSKYLEEKNDYLKELGLGNIDLKNIDFDVVIIDEVSKANSIELLIPILYGKSVILVGDHRQLPPLFKYKDKMFSDPKDKEMLSKYESLVENSLFKELFKKARKNKYMLVNQYRSHEQIMNVVNLFYDDKLKLGNSMEQNEAKRHYLNVTSNSYSLFEENIHTYWFNSHYDANRNVSYEKKKNRGSVVSTSFYNEEEIFLTKEILKTLDRGYKGQIEKGVLKEPCSVGVISLYGDQVKELKKEIGKMKFSSLNFNKSKISTVDEFQGREEDIIIVNFVRNNPKFEAGDFVKKFERINVALSRARKMLIIVASKQFFTNLNVNIENMEDSTIVNSRKIYKEIYDRVVGKIDEPNRYFVKEEAYED